MSGVIHQRTHPGLDVDGCFGCKVSKLHISPAVELRVQGNAHYGQSKRLDAEVKDMDAYRRLRREGHQPPHIAGCAEIEAGATHPYEITRGRLYQGKQGRQLTEAMSLFGDQGFDPTKPHDEPIAAES